MRFLPRSLRTLTYPFFYGGILCAAILGLTAPVQATTYTVTSTADDGSPNTLRWAINQANGNSGADTITITATGTITLTSALPAITESVTITGPGAASLTIDGNNLYRPLTFLSGTVTLRNLTIQQGQAQGGQGGNTTGGGGGGGAAGLGGAILIQTDAVISNVTFDDNAALGGNGGGYTSGIGHGGGGGGGIGGNGANAPSTTGGNGGSATPLSGTPGTGGTSGNVGTAGGEGAGGGGGGFDAIAGAGGFGAGGGGSGEAGGPGSTAQGGTGGFGGGGGAGFAGGGTGGTFGGDGYDYDLGSGGGGGGGLGGAIFIRSGTTRLFNCTFSNNTATGGTGGTDGGSNIGGNGQGKGGAIFANAGATVYVANNTFTSNTAADAGSTNGDNNDNYGTLTSVPLVSSIALANSNPTNATSVGFTVTFNTTVTGVNAADFALTASGMTGSSVTGVSGSGTTYTVTVNTGTGEGTLRLDVVDDDSITDGVNPLGGAGTGNGDYTAGSSYTIDNVAPTITLASSAPNPTHAAFTVTVTLSENSGNFAAGDITPTNGTVSNFSGSGSSYSFTLTPTADGTVSAVVNASTFTDGLNNNNTASNTLSRTYDGTAPTITLSTSAASAVNGPISITVTLSETSSNFAAGDITPTNGTVSNFSGSGSSYSFTLTPTAPGTFSAGVNAATFTDAAGNNNTASNTLSRTYDHTGPTITLSTSAASAVNGPITITATLSEDSSNFTAGDLTPANAAVSNFSGSGAAYSFTLTPTANGIFSVDVNAATFTDTAGNSNTASNTLTRTYDGIGPTVTLSSSAANVVNGPITITATLDESSVNFTADDLTATNGTVSNFSGSGTTYSFTLTPTASGEFTVGVNAAAFTDAAGNDNVASDTLTRICDILGPTILLSSTTADTVNGPIFVSVSLSEIGTNFAADDLVASNASISDFTSVAGNVYSFTLTPAAPGIFSVHVAAGTFADALGNTNTESNTLTRTYSTTGPTILLSSSAATTVNGPITITVALSEDGGGFTADDLTTTNATASGFSGGNGAYSFTLTPSADGTFGVNVAAGAFIDIAGNANSASNALSRMFDSAAPTITGAVPAATTLTTETSVSFQVTFSEDVNGFDSSDVTVNHTGTSSTELTVTPTGAHASIYTVTVGGISGHGSFTLTINAGAGTDTAGNTNAAGLTSAAVTVSPVASPPAQPVLTIDITASLPDQPPTAGDFVSFILDVANTGDGDATGVVVEIPLPAGLTFVAADLLSPNEQTARKSELPTEVVAGVARLSLGTLPTGESRRINMLLQALQAGDVSVQAGVLSAESATPTYTTVAGTTTIAPAQQQPAEQPADLPTANLCGFGFAAVSPLTLLGMLAMKRQYGRRRR